MSIASPGWQSLAACAGNPGPFFGPDRESEARRERREAKAMAICAGCPVQTQCGEFAAEHSVWFGVWSGENLELRRRRLCRNSLHLMIPENIWTDPTGHRYCRECRDASNALSRARQRETEEAA